MRLKKYIKNIPYSRSMYSLHVEHPEIFIEDVKHWVETVNHYIADNVPSLDNFKILFTGQSGMILAHYLVLSNPKLKALRVGKHGENAHSGVSSIWGDYNCLIVDDFIESGDTVSYMLQMIHAGGARVEALALMDTDGYLTNIKRKYVPKGGLNLIGLLRK